MMVINNRSESQRMSDNTSGNDKKDDSDSIENDATITWNAFLRHALGHDLIEGLESPPKEEAKYQNPWIE